MLAVAKFLHFLGLMLGAGAGFGTMAVSRQIRRHAGQPTHQLASLRPILAAMALVGIALLWVSGLWLYFAAWRGTDLGWAFHAKMGLAGLLLALIAAINLIGFSARRRGAPPPPWLPYLGMATPVLTLAVVALAVAVFA